MRLLAVLVMAMLACPADAIGGAVDFPVQRLIGIADINGQDGFIKLDLRVKLGSAEGEPIFFGGRFTGGRRPRPATPTAAPSAFDASPGTIGR